jgi:hypothetical protein
MKTSNRRNTQGLKIYGYLIPGKDPSSFLQKCPWITGFFFIFLLLLVYPSCTPESCFEETNAFVKVTFYNNATGKQFAPDSLTLFGLNMETNKLYNKALKVQPALLPLDANTGNCEFIVRINGVTDTLGLSYKSYPHLISKECGYSFYHTIDTTITVTNNSVDKIRMIKRNITTINEENIRIYY